MTADSQRLDRYLGFLLAKSRFIILWAVLGGVLGGLYIVFGPAVFTAQAKVLISTDQSNPYDLSRAPSAYIDASTESALLDSKTVTEAAAESLGVKAGEVKRASSGSITSNSTVMVISYRADSAEEAIAGADAVAQAYIAARVGMRTEWANTRLANIDAEVATLSAEIADLNARLAGLGERDPNRAGLETERTNKQSQLTQLLAERVDVTILDGQGGQLLESGDKSTIERDPAKAVVISSGVVLGVLIGIVLAWLHTIRQTKTPARPQPVSQIADSVSCFTLEDIRAKEGRWAELARELFVQALEPIPTKIAVVGSGQGLTEAVQAIERILRDDGVRIRPLGQGGRGLNRAVREMLRDANADVTVLVPVPSLQTADTDAAARLTDGLVVVADQHRIVEVTEQIQKRGHRVLAAIATTDGSGGPVSGVVAGVRVDAVSMDETVQTIIGWCRQGGRPRVAVGINAHVTNQAADDPRFATMIERADLVYADGASIVKAGRKLGLDIPERVATTDLIWPLAEAAAAEGWSMFFFGSAPGVAQRAAERVRQQHQIPIGYADGYADATDPGLIGRINASGADILLVGLGDPAQQEWVAAHREELDARAILTCGGLFDWTSGDNARPPGWMVKIGLEWLWRLRLEPRRLGKRYLKGNPRFIRRVWAQRLLGPVNNRPRRERIGR